MKRLFNILSGSLGLLVLAGLVVVVYFALNSVKPPQIASNPVQSSSSPTPVQVEPAVAATATHDPGVFQSPLPAPVEPLFPTPTGIIQPPLCQFEDKTTSQPEQLSELDKFVFSEPQIIFSREAPIDLIESLPDNQQLLVHITTPLKQSIETVDTTTGVSEVYADKLENARQVHWVEEQSGVVYTDQKTAQFSGIEQYALWLSQDKEKPPQLLLENAEQLKAKEYGQILPPGVAKALSLYDFSFDPEQWRYEKYPEDPYFLQSWRDVNFASSVSSDGSKAVFYDIPWLYLVDLKTNQPCEVDLGKFMRARTATWSPDGKLLAMLVTDGYRGELIPFSKLIILNTVTGEIYRPEMKENYIWDVAWFPDSRYLVVMGYSDKIDQPQLNQRISIVDSLTQQSRLMLPDNVFAKGTQGGFQLVLSSDGKRLIVNCPLASDKYPLGAKGQVCLISIN